MASADPTYWGHNNGWLPTVIVRATNLMIAVAVREGMGNAAEYIFKGALFLTSFMSLGSSSAVVGLGRAGWGARGAFTAAKGTRYTKSSLKLGQQMHKAYKANFHNPAKGLYKEFTGIKGIRPDFLDFNKRIIFELKPNNPRQIQAGWKQLNNYKKLFEQQYGGKWKTVLDLY